MRSSLKLLTAIAVAIAAAAVAVGALAGGKESAPSWSLVWADEFSGAAGTPPDGTKWIRSVGGFYDGQLEYYTDRTDNVRLDGNGNLELVARREAIAGGNYSSGAISTPGLFSQAYGRFEARMKIPSGQGLGTAFWMLGDDNAQVGWPDCGEIDVMEALGREPSVVHGSIHGPGFVGSAITTAYDANISLANDFHVYAIEWSPEKIDFFLDGTLYVSYKPADLPAGGRWVFDHPFYLILNLGIGGPWVGDPDSSTVFPATLSIDYVRVYELRSTTTTAAGRDTSDSVPPTRPKGLHALRRGSSTFTLAWSKARDNVGVTGYLVFLGKQQVGSTSSTLFVLRKLKPGTTYRIAVRAEDAAGNVSAPAAISVRTCRASTRC